MNRFKKGRAYLFADGRGARIIALARESNNVNGQVFEIVRANEKGENTLERCANAGKYFFAQTCQDRNNESVECAFVLFARRKFHSNAEMEVSEY